MISTCTTPKRTHPRSQFFLLQIFSYIVNGADDAKEVPLTRQIAHVELFFDALFFANLPSDGSIISTVRYSDSTKVSHFEKGVHLLFSLVVKSHLKTEPFEPGLGFHPGCQLVKEVTLGQCLQEHPGAFHFTVSETVDVLHKTDTTDASHLLGLAQNELSHLVLEDPLLHQPRHTS